MPYRDDDRWHTTGTQRPRRSSRAKAIAYIAVTVFGLIGAAFGGAEVDDMFDTATCVDYDD